MTDCPNGDIRDLLPDLLHGRLTPAERTVVEAHVRDCVTCQEELELLANMRDALGSVPAVNVDRIAAGIAPYRAPARRATVRGWSGWRVAAAVTLLAAGGTSVVIARHAAPARSDSTHVMVARSTSGATAVASNPAGPPGAVPADSVATRVATAPEPRELALAGGAIGDLDDRELSALLDDIGSLDAVPSAEVDQPVTVSPIAPTSPSGSFN